MGIVYKAEDTKLKRTVALKFLPPELTQDKEAKKRFIQEAQAAAALNHPNICTIYEVDEADSQTFISMEYIEGQTLKDKLTSGPLSIDEAKELALKVAEGLSEAHQKGVVHRDIKPANIMLPEKGQAKITDFGLAKLSGGADLTKASTIMGTVAYMSPEQAKGEEVDHRTDIWSLGAMLYEMLSGERPFNKSHEQALIHGILNEEPTPIKEFRAGLPSSLERAIQRCLTKNAGDRYRNAREFMLDLKSGPSAPLPKFKNSIAVLPFTNMSADTEQEYFCDGISEEIINSLTQISELRVVARTSAFSFKGKDIDVREIGQKLSVDKVLEGSVRKSGKRLRITAQLINVNDGYHLWSERYDRNLEDVFEIQDEISLAIVDSLKMRLLRKEKERLVKRATEDSEAYNYYLKGRYFWNKRNEEGLAKSVECFEKAIEIDPEFALAFAGLADTISTQGFYDFIIPRKKAFDRARTFAQKALQLDDSIGETHVAFGNILAWCDYEWDSAEKEYRKALQLNPSDAEAHHMYAHLLSGFRRHDEAIVMMGEALVLEPLSVNHHNCKGIILFAARRYDEAIYQFETSIDIDPNFSLHHYWLGRVYVEKKLYEKAWKHLESASEFVEIQSLAKGALAYAYGVGGKGDEAQMVLNQLIDISQSRYVDPFHLAVAYIGLGEADTAFGFLDRACEELSMYNLYLPTDPIFDSLRDAPEFAGLMNRLGIG
jgi:serine/threonine protein kinase/Tfp pilus assembly protein PilF